MKEAEMMNLFAVPLYRGNLGRQLDDGEVHYLREQIQDANVAIANYASKNKRVLEAKALAGLREVLQTHIDGYFQRVFNTSNRVRLEITQSWVAHTRKGESHHQHVHPNSVASGVFYINVAEQDGINFYRNEDNIWHELLRQQDTYYNAHRYFIPVQAGDILIFPSNIRHGVATIEHEVERLSLAFNTFFSGELGREEFSNYLKIELKK